jgi:hypothetical protein
MTIGMVGWAWYESLSLALITIDSVVNLVGLVAASWAARVLVRRSHEQHALLFVLECLNGQGHG